jgi:Flp pilus assembly protein TadD
MRLMLRSCSILFVLFIGLSAAQSLVGQGSVNSSGNGGIHSIKGRIFLPNGHALETSILIELRSTNHPTLTVYTDTNGSFSFAALEPGSYTVVVNAGDAFQIALEYFLIDKEVQGRTVRIAPVPKTLNAVIHLRAKANSEVLVNEVVNAKWANVPKSAIQHFRRGLELVRENNDRAAEVEFRKALEFSPSFAPAHTELGKIAQRAGNLKASIESWKSAVRYDPADFDAHLNLGIAYLNLKNYADAEAELVSAAFLNQAAVTPHYYLGIVFVMKNDLDIARKAFETARDLKGGKTLPAIHKYLGRIYMAKHMDKDAVRELETYLDLSPAAQDAAKVRRDISDLKARQN